MKSLLWILIMVIFALVKAEEYRWGILSVFPHPMPLTHSAQVFPRFFASNVSMQLPFLPWDGDIASLNDSVQLELEGLLCFQIFTNISQNSNCIQLYNQTAAAVNNLSANVAEALDVQSNISGQLKADILLLNQRVDLVQEQVDVIMELMQLGCAWKFSGLCVTSVPFNNASRAAELSRNLSRYLSGNWSLQFDGLVRDLRQSIVHINSTRIDLAMAGGLMDWLTAAASHLKEWAGLAGLALGLVLVSVLAFWCICRMQFHQSRTQALMIQAFAAVEMGQSPHLWLGMLEK